MNSLSQVKNLINSTQRFWNRLASPSKQANHARLSELGQTIDSFIIREAADHDLRAVVNLHVKTWTETYRKKSPSYAVRDGQWRQFFSGKKNGHFVFVIESQFGELIGFAAGKPYTHPDLPHYNGELNKIYILKNYQRLGFGRKLFEAVTQEFVRRGITSMVLFGTPQNPACSFYEALGGKKLFDKNGVFHGGYGWRDLRVLPEPRRARHFDQS